MVKIKWVLQRKRRREREMEMEVANVQNLGHDHPLMLIKPEETDDSWDLTCYGCELPISGSFSDYYGCKRCVFLLHKTCAHVPHQMTHPSHPLQPLTLLTDPRTMNYGGDAACDICREPCNRFSYHCSLCSYDIDMKCALVVLSIQQSIQHRSHPHQLIPLLKESIFLCDACGEEHKGTSYLCTTCGFWINQKCASSPLYLKLNNHQHHSDHERTENNHHDHTLSLNYFVRWEDYSPFLNCEICSQTIYRRSWVYSCLGCHYVVHLQCAVNNGTEAKELDCSNSMAATSDADLSKVPTVNIKAQELDPTPINLPMLDNSVDIITQFIKNTSVPGKYMEGAEIKHSFHDHPLAYFDFKKAIDLVASRSMSNLSSLLKGERNAGKCNGCAQSISAPFYHCVKCKFSLHMWCAELPDELRHPGHPEHTLFLTMTNNYLSCDGCNLFQNTMYYVCSECSFFLDCKCASLPRVVNHETHKHTLALRQTFNSKCKSCGVLSHISFECGSCKLNLCIRCVFLPRTIRHRFDEHPFILNYSPLSYQTDDDFCEICEEGIDPNSWFYHCGECDQYLHKECVFPLISRKPYVSYGPAVASRKHQHRLNFVELYEDLLCSLCERNVHDDSAAYLCPLCKFCLCIDCYWNDR